MRRVQLVAAFLALSGCASSFAQLAPDPPGEYAALTTPVVFVADSQEHESAGFPLHDNSGAVDAYVEVAERPPEHPLFGRRLLEWAILAHPTEPIVHLGDVLDMSCASEMARMEKILGATKQPSVILPGNHDGLLFGIYNYDLLGDYLKGGSLAWRRGCRPGATPDDDAAAITNTRGHGPAVNKRDFAGAYLDMLARGPQPQAGLSRVPASGPAQVRWRNPDQAAFIQRIEAKLVDGREYAKTFIVQKLRLPAAENAPRQVVVVALDTTQLNVAIGLFNVVRGLSPGDTGRLLDDQVDAVRAIVDEAQTAGELVVFAGHHNWAKIDVGSRARLIEVLETLDQPLIYISAHTHSGFWARHRVGRRRHLLELNVSSLTDWPISYRRVTFAYDVRTARLKVTGELTPHRGAVPQSDDELLDAWKAAACAPSGIKQAAIEDRDLALVRAQKESRGTLVKWLRDGLGEWCTACQRDLYEGGHRYKDLLLDTIGELYEDLEGLPELHAITSPVSCAGATIPQCIASLQSTARRTLASSIALFRQKADFVSVVGEQLDTLTSPQARAYMACRAVLAAKDDHDLISDESQRSSEESRRKGHFFRTEATIGIE